jgi:hypothetical protein
LGGCTRDQTGRGGEWVHCNTVSLAAGNVATVKLGNNCESGKYVFADAVRFVRVSKDADDLIDGAGMDWTSGDQSFTLSTSPSVVRSVAITNPISGYVLVNASGYFFWTSSGYDRARCSITKGTTIDLTHLIYASDHGDTLTVNSGTPFAATRGYSVSAGTNIFNLVCDITVGSGEVHDSSLTAVFFPTRY